MDVTYFEFCQALSTVIDESNSICEIIHILYYYH